ncbi:hypothetical protein NE865_09420 [Phthorimaea operculella]|nr:hypothetical protein NE865_09420 [Phthorimaea operculella]
MLTARGFGKRDHPPTRSEHVRAIRSLVFDPHSSILVGQRFGKRVPETNEEDFQKPNMVFRPRTSLLTSRGFGKRVGKEKSEELGLDNFWSMLEAPEGEVVEGDGKLESIPMDWFVNEMLNNPDFARSVVRKFIDLNQDGMLSTDELLRNVD